MRVTFLGTGSAMPVPGRSQTGLLLEADEARLLVDCGSGVLGRLSGTDTGYEGVSTVLLTHHHLDHVSDLLALLKARWLAGEEHLQVVGPPGTKALVDDLLAAFDYLDGRVDLSVREVPTEMTFEAGGFRVRAIETRHSMTAYAYRFAVDEDPTTGPFTFSGDSEAFAGMASFVAGSRVLAHDCSFPDGIDVSNHPTPTQLGNALAGSDVDRLYLTHLYPHTRGRESEMIESVSVAGYDGEVHVAEDGLRIDVSGTE